MSKFIKVTLESNSEMITVNADQIIFIDKGKYGCSKLNMIGGQSFTVLESIEQIEARLIRDEFAKGVMNGIISNPFIDDIGADGVAHDAYLFADAMLKERSK